MTTDPIDSFQTGSWVRLKSNPQKNGIFRSSSNRSNREIAVVDFYGTIERIPIDQLEAKLVTPEDPLDFLKTSSFSEPERLRKVLAHIRLTGRLSDIVYSMESTNTDFHAHQFKPILKILNSPTGNLLIADEVGLGKTIEAGLLWTELRARFDYNRLLVVCPKILCTKWQTELDEKFDVDARICSAGELLETLSSQSSREREFVRIAGLQGLRPSKNWAEPDSENGNRASSKLARFLDERVADEPLFDMVVFDEAHHLRNQETQSHEFAKLLRPLTKHLVFLSATPIHLKNEDLFSLLSLLDPETFHTQMALREILEANEPIIAARDATLSGKPVGEVLKDIGKAQSTKLLSGSRQLQALTDELQLKSNENFGTQERSDLAGHLENTNLLANTVNRTRRRDVQAYRVVRKVSAFEVDMTGAERGVYDEISRVIQKYAFDRDISAGFLLSSPQRLLCSSMPAAISHWRADDRSDTSDDEEDESDKIGPLTARIREAVRQLPPVEVLRAQDSKFDRFHGLLTGFLHQNPDEKLIVFSTFRPTLDYLRSRLTDSGIQSLTIHGAVKERTNILENFRTSTTIPVLLSSEVGSEGVDLQFSRTVINYDLPWNPMKVEQRIGRVDRLGQASDSISVLNFFHGGTIDAQIYRRLYERLQLCEKALGGFEAVLGEKIRQLTPDLLRYELSGQQIRDRLDQTAQALETRRKNEEELEREAAALIAHADHILRAIDDARSNKRWIGARELGQYLRDGLSQLYPGSRVRDLEDDELAEIALSDAARHDYFSFCEIRGVSMGAFSRPGPVRCRLGRPEQSRARVKRAVSITQTHPLVGFTAERIKTTEAPNLRPAVAARLPLATLPQDRGFRPGVYALAAHHWTFFGTPKEERIAYAGARIGDSALMTDDDAELLMNAVASEGSLWRIKENEFSRDQVVSLVEDRLYVHLENRFFTEASAQSAKKQDRLMIQLSTLETRFRTETNRVRDVLQRQELRLSRGEGKNLGGVINMNRKKLEKLQEKFELQRKRLSRSTQQSDSHIYLALALVSVQ